MGLVKGSGRGLKDRVPSYLGAVQSEHIESTGFMVAMGIEEKTNTGLRTATEMSEGKSFDGHVTCLIRGRLRQSDAPLWPCDNKVVGGVRGEEGESLSSSPQ